MSCFFRNCEIFTPPLAASRQTMGLRKNRGMVEHPSLWNRNIYPTGGVLVCGCALSWGFAHVCPYITVVIGGLFRLEELFSYTLPCVAKCSVGRDDVKASVLQLFVLAIFSHANGIGLGGSGIPVGGVADLVKSRCHVYISCGETMLRNLKERGYSPALKTQILARSECVIGLLRFSHGIAISLVLCLRKHWLHSQNTFAVSFTFFKLVRSPHDVFSCLYVHLLTIGTSTFHVYIWFGGNRLRKNCYGVCRLIIASLKF